MLAKSLSFLAGADAAGIVLGARVPIILTSRADSVTTRLASCGVAALVAQARRESGDQGGSLMAGRASPSSTPARRASSSRCSRATAASSTLVARGQAEGLFTSPRFVAKDGDGDDRSTRRRGARASSSATTARSTISLAFLRARFARAPARRRRPPRRARRPRVRAAGARRRGGASRRSRSTCRSRRCTSRTTSRRSGCCSSARPTLPQVACFDTAFHRGQPAVAQAFALPRGDHRSRRAALRLPRPVVRIHRAGAAAVRRARGRRQDRRAAPRQRRQHVRDRRRAQRREHDGLHRRRRPADGHALRQPRSRA